MAKKRPNGYSPGVTALLCAAGIFAGFLVSRIAAPHSEPEETASAESTAAAISAENHSQETQVPLWKKAEI